MKNMEGEEEDGTDSDCKLCLHYSFADCLVVACFSAYFSVLDNNFLVLGIPFPVWILCPKVWRVFFRLR